MQHVSWNEIGWSCVLPPLPRVSYFGNSYSDNDIDRVLLVGVLIVSDKKLICVFPPFLGLMFNVTVFLFIVLGCLKYAIKGLHIYIPNVCIVQC